MLPLLFQQEETLMRLRELYLRFKRQMQATVQHLLTGARVMMLSCQPQEAVELLRNAWKIRLMSSIAWIGSFALEKKNNIIK